MNDEVWRPLALFRWLDTDYQGLRTPKDRQAAIPVAGQNGGVRYRVLQQQWISADTGESDWRTISVTAE